MDERKQILEIADILLEVSRQDSNGVNTRADFAEFDADTIFKYGCDRLNGAAALCRAGYRKQVEGEWQIPAVDSVEVVRCRDCKYWRDTSIDTVTEDHWGECRKPLGDFRYCETAENDFCSYGEKGEEQ